MRNIGLLTRRLVPGVRLMILGIIILLIAGNIIGWLLFIGCSKSNKQETVQLREENSSMALKAEKLERINSILYANVKETDGWIEKKDKLIIALALELPTTVTVDKVAEIALANKGPEDVYLFGKIFKVGKSENNLTSKEVKVREIGRKIHWLVEGGENY